jgi:hypothetical protein
MFSAVLEGNESLELLGWHIFFNIQFGYVYKLGPK